MRKPTEVYDFKAFGQAIKAARKAKGYTRERLGKELDIAPRYLVSIENEGQHPSLQVFYELVTFFDISVDQFFFPAKAPDKTTQRRQLDELLNGVDETDLIIAGKLFRNAFHYCFLFARVLLIFLSERTGTLQFLKELQCTCDY